jgi:guanosine-3',5'-bis(diphosphate) 3'-pyrophosphohydrolase
MGIVASSICTSSNNYDVELTSIMREVRQYLPNVDEKRIKKAFYYASKAHAGQIRKDKTPYITHPIETAKILISMHVDEDTIVTALLHDVPEDTTCSIKDIESEFGQKVAFLVAGITKLSKVHYKNDMAHRQIQSLKKLFLHTAHDPRIIFVKLADRLHNMRTLQFIDNEQKRNRISRETLEIFVPIARLLGIEEIKSELEDLCFKFLLPDEFSTLSERMARNRDANLNTLEKTIDLVEKELKKNHIHATVEGRNMHLYSIYKKVVNTGRQMNEYDDMIATKILVQTQDECYKTLGVLHSLFKPKTGRFKDYIAVPKSNGYQSLHSCVFGVDGKPTEFQIRTQQMQMEAEYGMASRYFHTKNKNGEQDFGEDKRSLWLEKIVQMEKTQHQDDEFMEGLQRDVFRERIFVFTPKGQSIDLPQDATCIDFAYQIHTEIGNRALKADVNGEIVPMATVLKNGDTVSIIHSDYQKGPDRLWLAFARTNTAKNRIREYFKKISRVKKIEMGASLLQKELGRAGLCPVKNVPQRKIRKYIAINKQYQNYDDILMAIGEGSLRPLDFVSELYPQKSATLGLWKWFEFPAIGRHKKLDTPVYIKITSKDAVKQLEKILSVVSSLGINALKTKAYISFWTGDFILRQKLAIRNFSVVSRLFENLEQIDGVKKVERVFWQKNLFFIGMVIVTFALWGGHPFVLHYWAKNVSQNIDMIILTPLLYVGLLMLFVMVFLFKRIAQRSLPQLRETQMFWLLIYLLTTFAAITVFAEIYFFKLDFNLLVVGSLILLFFSYLTAQHVSYCNNISKIASDIDINPK